MRLPAAALLVVSAVPLGAQATPIQIRLTGVLPPSISTTQLALSSDANRVYFGDSSRAVWLYDRTTKKTVSIAHGEALDITLSQRGDALALARASTAGTAEHYIYIVPLDPRTGLPSGPERRASASAGDAPSISPDGKMLAFARDDASGVGQSVVVVAMSGGKERALAGSLHSSISNIRWSPDGQSLYYGVNPPVPCNPDWSCLDLKPEFTHHTGTVRRVSLVTGKSEVVASQVANGWPGLSADGSLLAFTDTTYPANLIVADAHGKILHTISMVQRQTVEGWLSGSTLLFSDRGDVQQLTAYSIADGSTKVLADTLPSITDPAASPDGTMLEFVSCASAKCEMHVLRADGTTREIIALPDNYHGSAEWSPDSKHVAYFGDSGVRGELHASVVAAAAGTVKSFSDIKTNAWALAWTDDSRAITLSMVAGGTGAGRKVAMSRVTLDGASRALRDIPLGATPSTGRAIDMTTAITIRGTEVRRVSFDGDSASAVLLPSVPTRYLGWFAQSREHDRIAFRRTADTTSDDVNVIEVLNNDGGNHVTIPLPFALLNGPTTIRFLPGGAQLVVLGFAAGVDGVGAYLVDIVSKSAKRLFTIAGGNFTRELSVSPDGRTIYYVTNGRSTSRVFTMDMASNREEKN
jgi:Tol biopolymer transport system component